jgi:hypothetical protein
VPVFGQAPALVGVFQKSRLMLFANAFIPFASICPFRCSSTICSAVSVNPITSKIEPFSPTMPWLTEIPCCFSPVKQVSNSCRGIERDRSRIKDGEMRDTVRPSHESRPASLNLAIRHRILKVCQGHVLFILIQDWQFRVDDAAYVVFFGSPETCPYQ